MKTINRILVPTDFSTHADQALAYGLGLARRHNAVLHVLHIINQMEGGLYSPLRYTPENAILQETPDVMIHRMMEQLLAKHNTEGVTVVPEEEHSSTIAPRILAFAQRQAIDLIVMGTHGHQGIKHAMLGSVAEELVRKAPCSVITLRKTKTDWQATPQHILAAVDFSPQAEGVLELAIEAARRSNATLDILHVIEPLAFPVSLTGVATIYDLIPDIENKIRVHLKRLLSDVDVATVQINIRVEDGRPSATICDYAEEHHHDLIVMGTHGYSGVRRFFMGSVAERVLRHAPCPVLIAKALETDIQDAVAVQAEV